MTFSQVFIAALAANGTLFMFIAGIWRIGRNERDWRAYAMVFGAAIFMFVSAIAASGY